MPTVHDLQCDTCSTVIQDFLLSSIPSWENSTLQHFGCGGRLDILWRARRRQNVQWSDREACVVFQDAQGNIRYPGRNDVTPPPGFERVEMRSLREVERFSASHNVRNEIVGFDHGHDGEGFNFEPEPVAPPKWDTSWNDLMQG